MSLLVSVLRNTVIYIIALVLNLDVTIINARAEQPPNLVLILLDAARADRFSINGYKRKLTPEMDKIAAKGANFRSHYANSSFTATSTPQLLSSRYYSINLFSATPSSFPGPPALNDALLKLTYDSEQVFLYEVLRANGYRSAMISENPMFFGQDSELERGFDHSYQCSIRDKGARCVIEQTTRRIDEYSPHPFFLYIHIMLPHFPCRTSWSEGFLSSHSRDRISYVRQKAFAHEKNHDLTPDELEVLDDLYDSNVRLADRVVGSIYEHLEKSNLAENTIFVITADHGENLGTYPNLFHLNPLHEQYSRIPLIITYPRRLKENQQAHGMTSTVDVMPTLLELAEIAVPKNKTLDGISLLPCIDKTHRCRIVVPKAAGFRGYGLRSEKYSFYSSSEHAYEIGPKDSPHRLPKPFPKQLLALADKVKEDLSWREKRFRNSLRKKPPSYPFRLRTMAMKLSAQNGLERHVIDRNPDLWRSLKGADEKWRVAKGPLELFLVYNAASQVSDPPFAQLEAAIPDGDYEISLILRSKLSEQEVSELLLSRFEDTGEFNKPISAIRMGKPNTSRKQDSREFFSVLLIDGYRVRNRSVKITVLPHKPHGPIVIESVLFRPKTSMSSEEGADTPGLDRKTVKELESLGYM